jgi:hypothetical protein
MPESSSLPSPWASTTPPIGEEYLVLDAACEGTDDPALDLSAAARHGDTLFLGSDEGVCLERLSRGPAAWAGHQRFPLDAIFALESSEEADVEGLAEDDGWLWVLGSHARRARRLEERATIG